MPDTQADKDTSNAGGTDSQSTTQQPGADAGKKSGLQFTPEHVDWINKHSDEMFGKGHSKAKTEYEAKLTAAEQRAKEFEDKLKSLEAGATTQVTDDKDKDKAKGKAKSDEPSDEVVRIKAKLEELTGNMTTLLQRNQEAETALARERENNRKAAIKNEFMSAASTLNFFDANDVFRLIEHEIGFDENHGVIVKNDKTGEPRMTASGAEYRPVTLAEYLSEFASKKPQYVKAKDTDGGSGSGGSRTLQTKETSNLPDFSKMSLEEVAAYASQAKTRR